MATVKPSADLSRSLREACRRGKEDSVCELIRLGADVNEKSGRNAPLNVASRCGHLGIVRILVENGARINPMGKDRAALSWAARAGHSAVVEFLLGCGAEIDATEDRGRTALLMAVLGRHGKSLAVLLRNGANPNKSDDDNMYPVTFAVKFQWSEGIRLLLSHGANANQDSSEGTPLVLLCANPKGKKALCLFRFLLKKRADANKVSRVGSSVVYTKGLNHTPLAFCAAEGNLDFLEILLQHGGQMEACLCSHHPLVLACEKENNAQTSIIYTLLRNDIPFIVSRHGAGAVVGIADGEILHKAKKVKRE